MNRRTLLTGVLTIGVASRLTGTGAATPVAIPSGYAHPEWLADHTWLASQLGDPALALVALTPPDDFAQGHIPGAVQVDWPDLGLSESAQIDAWRTEMETLLTNLGVERSDTVVIYDGGTIYAPRLWWILYQLGHADVRILNGGLAAWSAAGETLETGAVTPRAAAEPYVGEPNNAAIATVDQVAASLDHPDSVLVDARTADEYAAGHIPGAVLFPFDDVVVGGQPRVWKTAEELQAAFSILDVTPDKHVIPYCSTGVRSAALYFTLRLIGFQDAALFSGSYAEWTADSTRPVEQGAGS